MNYFVLIFARFGSKSRATAADEVAARFEQPEYYRLLLRSVDYQRHLCE